VINFFIYNPPNMVLIILNLNFAHYKKKNEKNSCKFKKPDVKKERKIGKKEIYKF